MLQATYARMAHEQPLSKIGMFANLKSLLSNTTFQFHPICGEAKRLKHYLVIRHMRSITLKSLPAAIQQCSISEAPSIQPHGFSLESVL